jgi:hypothetical protein
MQLQKIIESFENEVIGGLPEELNKFQDMASPFIWIEQPIGNSGTAREQVTETYTLRINCLEYCESDTIDNFKRTSVITQRCKQVLDKWIGANKKQFQISNFNGVEVLHILDRNYIGWKYNITFTNLLNECC